MLPGSSYYYHLIILCKIHNAEDDEFTTKAKKEPPGKGGFLIFLPFFSNFQKIACDENRGRPKLIHLLPEPQPGGGVINVYY